MKMLIISLTVLSISSAMATSNVPWEGGSDTSNDTTNSYRTDTINPQSEEEDIVTSTRNNINQTSERSTAILDFESDSSSDCDFANLGVIPWN